MTDRMVIVGAGECGARAAFALREMGYDGPVTMIGDEPYAPYERPPLSKDILVSEGEPTPKWTNAFNRFAEQRIELRRSTTVLALDRQRKTISLAGGETIRYRRLLLATGAVPRTLTIAPKNAQRIAYLRNYADSLLIRTHLRPGRHIAIIGGGFIGLEVAASARRRGADVTIIEAQPRILMRGVPGEIAAVVADRHLAEGVRLLCGRTIESVREAPNQLVIDLAGGESISFDLAIVGVGARPATELAQAAGLEIDNGVAVDERLTTSDPEIFAAGDCCSFPLPIYGGRRVRLESWRNAQEQGALAAKNMLGASESVSAAPWFWSDQYELTLQVAGLAEGAVSGVRRDLGEGAFILFHLAADGRLLAASGIGAANAAARDIRIAEILISRGARPDPLALAAREVKLKTLL